MPAPHPEGRWRINASTGVNPFRIPFIEPGRRIRVRGFSGQFLSQYEVLPRRRADVLPAD